MKVTTFAYESYEQEDKIYMAWRNVLSAQEVKQKRPEAINNTFRCHSSYKKRNPSQLTPQNN